MARRKFYGLHWHLPNSSITGRMWDKFRYLHGCMFESKVKNYLAPLVCHLLWCISGIQQRTWPLTLVLWEKLLRKYGPLKSSLSMYGDARTKVSCFCSYLLSWAECDMRSIFRCILICLICTFKGNAKNCLVFVSNSPLWKVPQASGNEKDSCPFRL